ncbi:peptidoglycan DD-metalloendopeptidase family protein [Microcoleus sp. FACHB-672]|uniref:peptidoglycan DD-metalloendopeptidase family protein n=1 Tax=Microcoleus sp. FACHB-672 TaxID=2692825 RepID=UPI0016864A64|nr:peptidoglycan DD-metalloendopeptidase family protein [Microcoleus sp. FACHB-672]MBD2040543.1 peptidoglycan DD-metalloendopeptidase family protein [Microcoleus sp. FACHB-672]
MEHATPGFSDASHKDRPSAALIGLAISMGASSLIVPQQGDAAYATEPAAPELTRVVLYTPDFIPASDSRKPQEELAATELTPTVSVRNSFNADVQVKFKDLIQSSGKLAERSALKTVTPRVAGKTESPATVIPATAITAQPAPAVMTVPVLEVARNIVLHKVQPGETLSSIASVYGVSLTDLIKFNELSDPSRLEINQTLSIPQTSAIRSDFSETASDESSNQSVAGTTLAASSPSVASRYANSFASQSEQPNQKYVENLRADLMRLREKYQTHKDKHPTHLPIQEAQNAEQPMVVPVQRNRSVAASRFSANTNTSQAQIQKLRQQQRELASKTQSSSWQTAAAESSIEPQQIAKASLGSEVYESLMNPLMNSPQLPPLNSPDTYLPKSPAYFNGYNWPAQGVLTSGYGWRWGRMHAGIDIAGAIGTPIMAAASGVVTYAGWDEGGYGNLVEIKHPDGSMTRYAHNDRILVRQGQQVEQGEQISEMGSTGFSTGPHLHFEIHQPGGGAENPMAYLPPA